MLKIIKKRKTKLLSWESGYLFSCWETSQGKDTEYRRGSEGWEMTRAVEYYF